jgi:hypothetical protein
LRVATRLKIPERVGAERVAYSEFLMYN